MSESKVLYMRVAGAQLSPPAHPRVRLQTLEDLLSSGDATLYTVESNSEPRTATASSTDTLYEALRIMNEKNVRFLSVMVEDHAVGVISKEQLLTELVSYLERVYHEYQLDQQIAFLQGTYSC